MPAPLEKGLCTALLPGWKERIQQEQNSDVQVGEADVLYNFSALKKKISANSGLTFSNTGRQQVKISAIRS